MTGLKQKPRTFIGVIAIILIVVNVVACGETLSSSQKNAPLSDEDATSTGEAYATSTSEAYATALSLSMTQYAQPQATEAALAAQATAVAAQAPQFLKQFFTLANLHDPGPPYSPYISGKVVIIDRPTSDNDKDIKGIETPYASIWETFGFPSDLFAVTPDEVGTIIWIDFQKQVLGWKYYPSGVDAVWWHSDVTIIDKTKNTVVGRKHFDGEDPPVYVENRVGCCEPPWNDMAQYIASLPRR